MRAIVNRCINIGSNSGSAVGYFIGAYIGAQQGFNVGSHISYFLAPQEVQLRRKILVNQEFAMDELAYIGFLALIASCHGAELGRNIGSAIGSMAGAGVGVGITLWIMVFSRERLQQFIAFSRFHANDSSEID